MIRQLYIVITDSGQVKIHGDDLPDMEELAESLGQQETPAVEDIIKNCRLCG